MSAAFKIQKNNRYMSFQALSRIEYVEAYNSGASQYSPKARKLIWFFLACVRLDYDEIRVPMEALRLAAAGGESFSRSVFYRAMRELENNGFIHRREYKPWNAKKISPVYINRNAFLYWLQRIDDRKKFHRERDRVVIPYPTRTHVSTPVSNGDPSLWTSDQLRVKPLNSSVYSKNKSARAHTRSKNDANVVKNLDFKKSKEKIKLHPILFTLYLLCWKGQGANRKPSFPNAKHAYLVAKSELNEPGSTNCGIPFDYYASIWKEELAIERRDYIAQNDFLPKLLKSRILRPDERKMPNEINQLVGALLSPTPDIQPEPDPPRPAPPAPKPPPPIEEKDELSPEERAILEQASKNAKTNLRRMGYR